VTITVVVAHTLVVAWVVVAGIVLFCASWDLQLRDHWYESLYDTEDLRWEVVWKENAEEVTKSAEVAVRCHSPDHVVGEVNKGVADISFALAVDKLRKHGNSWLHDLGENIVTAEELAGKILAHDVVEI
jgi:hypothetical protein